MLSKLRQYALAASAAGICVVPSREDGSKAPDADWKQYQDEHPTTATIKNWYDKDRTGIGFVCGAVSGNLEMLEFEDVETYNSYKAIATAVGLGVLVERIENGYLECTPGGGIHYFYRCDEISGSMKLARRLKRQEEMQHPNDKVKTLIETKGEGGYVVVAPSNGRVHPTGKPYELLKGGVASIVNLAREERQAILTLARTLDQMPKPRHPEPRLPSIGTGSRPGDEFNRRAAWPEILEPHGWQQVYRRDDETYWLRPGKDHGVSATTNYAGSDLLYVFTTSTSFDAERGYSKFAAYAVLNHGGDFQTAARDLSGRGYGNGVQPFPVEMLPRALRALVAEGAASLPAPPEFIAVPLVVAAGAVIGNALEHELKPGWREGANLFAGVIGEPGSKKSPAQALALQPIQRLQRRLVDEYRQAQVNYEAALLQWESLPKVGRGPKPEPPTFRHLFTTDATTEALAPMLLSAKGLVLIRDELAGWTKSMDQYRGGKGADRQHFLSMWSRTMIKVDRKGAPPIFVPRPCLAVVGGIQPDVLPELVDGGQQEDGFLDRLLWSYPDPVPDRWSPDGVSDEVIREVEAVFERLHALSPCIDDDGQPKPQVVRLSQGAAAVWESWYTDHAAEMAADALPQWLRGPWAKMPAQLARLALIFHALQAATASRVSDSSDVIDLSSPTVPAELSPETLGAAIGLVGYFKSHARRVRSHLGQQRRDPAVRVLEAIKAHGELSQSDLLHKVFHGRGSERMHRTLDELEEAGIVRRVEKKTGGRTATIWALA